MTISTIICTKNRRQSLNRTLLSLQSQTCIPDQIVIVDGAGNALDRKDILNSFSTLPILYIFSSPGLTHQRNIGLRESFGDIVLFLDDDVFLDKNYVKKIKKRFENQDRSNIDFEAVTGRIINLEKSKKIFILLRKIFLLSDLGKGKLKASGFPSHPYYFTHGGYIQTLSGCDMAFKQEIFDKVGFFDENLIKYSYMEDVDIAKRLVDAGYRIYYEPTAQLQHEVNKESRLDNYGTSRMLVVNHYYLFKKNWKQTLFKKFAFWWSVLGLIIVNLCSLNLQKTKGTIAGILDIFFKRNKLTRIV